MCINSAYFKTILVIFLGVMLDLIHGSAVYCVRLKIALRSNGTGGVFDPLKQNAV